MGQLRHAAKKQQLLLCQQGEESTATCVEHFISAHTRKLALYSGGQCSGAGIQVTHDKHWFTLRVQQL